MNLKSLANNKYLYYFALIVMLINVLAYVSLGSIECVLVFGIAAYASNYYTKNRTLDIFIALFVSNILFGCGRLKEGLATKSDKVTALCATLKTEEKCEEQKAKGCSWDKDKKKCLKKASYLKKAEAELSRVKTILKKGEDKDKDEDEDEDNK